MATTSLSSFCKEIYLTGSSLSPEAFLHIASDIARGMNCIHAFGLLHRDMNLGNFLITSDFCVKVCDFGLSKNIYSHPTSLSLSIVGAPPFHAPEIKTAFYSFPADAWSYGVALSVILGNCYGAPTYKLPFPEDEDEWFDVPRSRLDPKVVEDIGKVKMEEIAKRRHLAIHLAGYEEKFYVDLVTECLSFHPSVRPTFPAIVARLRIFPICLFSNLDRLFFRPIPRGQANQDLSLDLLQTLDPDLPIEDNRAMSEVIEKNILALEDGEEGVVFALAPILVEMPRSHVGFSALTEPVCFFF
jgi:serine/threonine protein kinase